MATETLAVNLLLNASQYKNEARQAATATGQISSSANTAGTATGGLGKKMSGLAATARFAVAGVATAAVVGFARDSIAAASNLQESINAVNVVFGEAAEGVHTIGESAADSFGMSQRAFNEFAVRFSAFAQNIAQKDGRQVVDVVDEMATRIADFASVHNLSLEEAAQVAQSTLAGETEVFRRFGGDVSAATVKAKGLELGLGGVTGELTEGEKQLVRYKLFMEQTDDVAGDFANTSDDLANAQRRVNSNLEDAKAKIGNAVVPVLGDMAAAVADVVGWLDELSVKLPGTGEELSALEGGTKALFGVFGLFSIIKDEVIDGFFGGTEEAIEATTLATEESIGASNRHRGAMNEAEEAADDLAESYGGVETSLITAAEAAEMYDTAFRRLTDPVFRHIDDQQRLQDSLKSYKDIMDDSEASTADQEAAFWDLLEAQANVNSSAAELPENMGRSTQAFLLLAEQLGFTTEETDMLRQALEAIDGKTYTAQIEAFFKSSGSQVARDVIAAGAGNQSGIRQSFHSGGVVQGPRGSEQVILAKAGETVLPTHDPGFTMPASGIVTSGGGANVYIGAVYGFDDFAAKVRDAGVTLRRIGG